MVKNFFLINSLQRQTDSIFWTYLFRAVVLNFLPVAFGGDGRKGLLFCFYSVALMNHSCCPNVIVTYKGTLAEVRAVKEIEPGEEVNAQWLNILCMHAS